MSQQSDSDPEVTRTFDGESADTNPVEVSGAGLLSEEMLGDARPQLFEDRYPISGTIGVGGMGEVYLAQDQVLKRDVALKVLRGGGHPKPQVLRRFLREAQLTAQLSHPNVVPFYAIEATGTGAPAFVMKWIEGQDLKAWLRDWKKRWNTNDWVHEHDGMKARVEFFLKACDAIAFSHDRGVIHRDLKPGNLMLGPFNVLYVMDWGIAKVVGEVDQDGDFHLENTGEGLPETRTMTGDLVGTPLYMAPEQADPRRTDEVGPASDQYALGLLLYQLITGEAPRGGNNVVAVIRAASLGEREAWPQSGPVVDAPRELRAIVDRATASAVGDRYPSVVEFADDLRRWLHGEEVRAHPDRPLRALWRRVERHPVTVLSGVLAVVLALGALSIWSLVGKLDAEQRALVQSARIAAVAERVHRMDNSLASAEQWLSTFGARVEEWISHADPADPQWCLPEQISGPDAPADMAPNDRYKQPVSFERSVTVLAPDADHAAAGETLACLGEAQGHFERLFREYARVPGEQPVANESRMDALVSMRERGFLQYAYCGFSNGLYLGYPAVAEYPEGYDPRKRPWYIRGMTQGWPTWGVPYADASGSGYLLPCVVSLHDEEGGLIGVAGLDVTVKAAIASLEIEGVDGLTAILLVKSTGGILLDTREQDDVNSYGFERFGNSEKDLRHLENAELVAALASESRAGAIQDGEITWIYARLRSLDWVLVARVVD